MCYCFGLGLMFDVLRVGDFEFLDCGFLFVWFTGFGSWWLFGFDCLFVRL